VSDLVVAEATPADAADIVDVIHRAFDARPLLHPPSTALDESVASVARVIEGSGALLCRVDGRPAGAVLFGPAEGAPDSDALRLRRVSALPELQSRGVASAMVGVAEEIAARRGLDDVVLEARAELPATLEFWYRRGYREIVRSGSRLTYGKALPASAVSESVDATREIGRRIGRLARRSDVLLLSGQLGAGKTTLVQGIAGGLDARGPITSPTFVLARVHPARGDGPGLVHVDAYRLASAAELDDLELDTYLDDAVVVVEWGDEIARGLSDDRLHIRIDREPDPVRTDTRDGDPASLPDRERRRLTMTPVGRGWVGRGLRSFLMGDPATRDGRPSARLGSD
jgi:tRNA threonylcarbamoyladenosine biosynthesis protein TsaE